MIGIVIGVLAILLGGKAFTATGLPLTKAKNLTGTTAKVIGTICILIGALLILDGALGTLGLFSRIGTAG